MLYMNCFAPSAASRRYTVRAVWISLIYAVLLIAAVYGFSHHLLTGAATWIAAILPALALIGIFVAIGLYLVEETDEYLRMLLVRQTLWASGFALSAATIWGFLESFELVDHIPVYWVSALWFLGLGIGALINRLTIGRRA
jgi:hypothetical protein